MLWLLMLACSSPAPEEAPVAPPPSQPSARHAAELDYWPKRTDLELDDALRTACSRSVADGKPVLIAFSAPWCPDCRRVRDLEAQEPLASEQAQWHKVVVDVGRFDKHQLLLGAFSIGKIVTWVALKPESCSGGPDTWPVLRKSVFEPATGSGPKTSESLADWLRTARTP